MFYNDMNNYILEVKFAEVPALPDDAAPCPRGLKEYCRLVAQLRWPVHLVLPEKLCEVSALAQRVSKATTVDLKAASLVLEQVKADAKAGRAMLKFRALR